MELLVLALIVFLFGCGIIYSNYRMETYQIRRRFKAKTMKEIEAWGNRLQEK